MSRYKKIIFKELDGGKGQMYYDKKEPNRFKTSLGLIPDRDSLRLKLAEDFASFNIASAKPIEWYFPVSCVHFDSSMEYLYHLVRVETLVKLYRNSGYANPTLKYTFGAGTSDSSMLISYRGLLLAWYSTNKSDWSDDNGTSFTSNTWAYSIPIGYKVAEDGALYVFTKDEIVKSVDGKIWTVFYTAKSNEWITDFDELDGEFYAVLRSDNYSNFCYFVKFDNNDDPVIIREVYSDVQMSMKVFDGRVIFALSSNGVISFYEWDKSDLKRIAFLDYANLTMMKFLYVDDEYLVFTAYSDSTTDTTLIKINCKNGLFRIKEFNPSAEEDFIVNALKFKGNLSVQMYDSITPTYYILMHRNDASETRQATGVYYTPVINNGRHVPAHLIIKHKPLGDDASVVVKAKTDQGATFNVTCITNTTNDSVYSHVNLKSLLNECDFIEFEVTLADSSNAGDVKDLELIYLYQPTGLENSK